MSKRDEWVLNVKATTVLEAARSKREGLPNGGEAAQQILFYEKWLQSVGPGRTVWIDLDDVQFFGLDLETLEVADYP